MWKVSLIDTTSDRYRFCINHKGASITNSQFLELLRDNENFRSLYTQLLKDFNFEAFFWENRPITCSSLYHNYECTVIKSEYLANQSADFQTFGSHFRKDKQVVSFPNLSHDARLIAPCPSQDDTGYAHIGSFLRRAPESQIHALWKQTGDEMLQLTGDDPIWLSTSGLGVYWLHIRIDSTPKYYQTQEYKKL